jgi:hypothetical protein
MMSRTLAAVAITGLLSACSSSSTEPAVSQHRDAQVSDDATSPTKTDASDARAHIPVAANEVPPSSPMYAGQEQFLYETWGLEKLNQFPPLDFMLNLLKTEPAVFGNQFSSFGFIPDPNDDLPIGLKRGSLDPTRVSETCGGTCHTGKLPDGRVWMGEANTVIDTSRFTYEVNLRWVAAGNASLLDAIGEQKDQLVGPGRIAAEQSETDPLIPDDIPVIYNLSKRGWLSKMGTSTDERSEVYLSLFGAGVGFPTPATATIPFPSDQTLAPFLAFFGSLAPPNAPAADAGLIAQGQAVYAQESCDSCHQLASLAKEGIVTVDENENGLDRYPDASPEYPRGSVHTSALEWADLTGHAFPPWDGGTGTVDSGPAVDAGGGAVTDAGDGGLSVGNGFAVFLDFIAAHHLTVNGSDGYVVPDLRGLWASGPYLHNGSVESLGDLLNVSSARAQNWSHAGFVIDTSTENNANFGHEFGTSLSASDKAALVAYLNSL